MYIPQLSDHQKYSKFYFETVIACEILIFTTTSLERKENLYTKKIFVERYLAFSLKKFKIFAKNIYKYNTKKIWQKIIYGKKIMAEKIMARNKIMANILNYAKNINLWQKRLWLKNVGKKLDYDKNIKPCQNLNYGKKQQ